jgi:regulator of RNase E activity RraA
MTTPTLPIELLDRLRSFDTATISNAIEHFKLRDRTTGYINNETRCQFPDIQPMVGYAITCTGDTSCPNDSRPSNIDKLVEVIDAAPNPSVIVMQHTGHDRSRSCFIGDIFSSVTSKLGSVGFVTDANVRDLPGIAKRTPEYQVFSAGTVASHGWAVFFDFNIEVTVAGLTIAPGDLLHGDGNGLISVPIDSAAAIADQAAEVIEVEKEMFAFLSSDDFTIDELKKRFVPHE